MGIGPIPYRAIRQWAVDHEVDPVEVFVRWIRRMDTAFLNAMRASEKAKDTANADRSFTPRG